MIGCKEKSPIVKILHFDDWRLFCSIRSDIVGADLARRSHFDARDDTHCNERCQNRTAAVADKGKCESDDRHKSKTNTDIDQDLEKKH